MADIAPRLVGITPEFWINPQYGCNLAGFAQDRKLRDDLDEIEPHTG